MREFVKSEQELLEKLSIFKRSNDFESLRVSNILSNLIPGYILHFSGTICQSDSVTLYLKKNLAEIKPLYHKLIDFILFIYELEELKLISIRKPTCSVKYNHYDTSEYTCIDKNIDSIENLVSSQSESISKENGYNSYSLNIQMGSKAFELMNVVIYPLPLLDDLVKNKFKDLELRRFQSEQDYNHKNYNAALKALEQSKCGIIISAIAVGLSALAIIAPIVYEVCFSDNVTTFDAKEIVTAIKEQKTVTIDSVNVFPADTFNVNIIQQKAKPAPKPQQEPLKQPLPNN